ncbi:MAG: hypothetical protein ACI4QX_09000, partial [Lachnospiraceae bacterium]
LTKPVKAEALQAMLAKYLDEKIIRQNDIQCDEAGESIQCDEAGTVMPGNETGDVIQCLEEIPELDVQTGLNYCMDKEFYEDMLKEYVKADKAAGLEQFFHARDWKNYKITIHALKSTSLTIGAVSLSEEAKALEAAATDGDESYIIAHHPAVMENYISLLGRLQKILK